MKAIAMRITSLFSFSLALLLGFSAPAHAQDYPSRPIKLVVPFPAGGGHDALARVLAERLGSRLGQPVIIDNKAGANGMIGAELVSRAAPDGYTILFGSPAEVVIAPFATKSMRYDPVRDLTPVTLAAMTPLVLVSHPSTGIKTLSELVKSVKAEPDKFSFGTPGTGSSQHLAGALLNSMGKMQLQHVPYKGASPATNDVLSGQIPFAIVGMAPVMSYLQTGRLNAVAATLAQRASFVPDIPTVSETPGFEGFEVTHWMGVLLPASTPSPIVQKLQGEFSAILKSSDLRDRFHGMGVDPVGNTSGEFATFLQQDRRRFGRMFELSGLKPE